MTSWLTAANALAGVVVGFVLKAIWDLITETRRNRREDRQRFLDEKLRAYSDFLAVAAHYGTALREMHENQQRFADLLQEGEAAMRRLQSDPKSVDIAREERDVERRREADAVAHARTPLLLAAAEQEMRALRAASAVVQVLAPPLVNEAVKETFRAALSIEAFKADDYFATLNAFSIVVREDLQAA